MKKDWKTRGDVLAALIEMEKHEYRSIADDDGFHRTWNIWNYIRRRKRLGDESKGTYFRAIRKMAREGLLIRENNRYCLTLEGREKAKEEVALWVLGD